MRLKFFKFIMYAILTFIYVWVSSIVLVFHGPFPSLKNYAIGMISTSMHNYLLEPLTLWTVSLADTKPNLNQNLPQDTKQSDNLFKRLDSGFQKISDQSIEVKTYKSKRFTAKILLIHDPKRIKVAVTKYEGKVGETVSEMVADKQAVAGINGGGFSDAGYRGTGGIPLGTTIHEGEIVTNDGSTQPIVGFTKHGELVVGNYNADELNAKGVTEALTFGPALVKNGEGVVQGDGGWGLAPRTAIGQKEDGTVIMIVTDGRLIHGPDNLGATIKDLMNLMLDNGAINAANLDGGSSSTMVKDGVLVNEPTDVLGERKVATSFIVMP